MWRDCWIRCWIPSSPPTVGPACASAGGNGLVDQGRCARWRAFQKLGRRLPKRLQPPGLRSRPVVHESDSVTGTWSPFTLPGKILRQLPVSSPQLLLKTALPHQTNCLAEPDLRRRASKVAQGWPNAAWLRLLRDVLGDRRRSVGEAGIDAQRQASFRIRLRTGTQTLPKRFRNSWGPARSQSQPWLGQGCRRPEQIVL